MLKTVMTRDGVLMANEDDDWAHDAAYAHALFVAMDESEDSTYKIRERAKELMSLWGYSE